MLKSEEPPPAHYHQGVSVTPCKPPVIRLYISGYPNMQARAARQHQKLMGYSLRFLVMNEDTGGTEQKAL